MCLTILMRTKEAFPPLDNMIIGIDASRANESERTGTEWYAYHLIQEFKKLDSKNEFRLYSPGPLKDGLENLPDNFQSRVLKSPTEILWTQTRLSAEMLVNPPDVLFVPAHTIPIIHPKKTVVTCHDVGFERFPELYATHSIGPSKGLAGLAVKTAAKIATGFKYSNNELDYHRWSMKFALKHAAKIITVSEFTKKEIQEIYNVSGKNISVIHNGFDQEKFVPESNQLAIDATLYKYGIDKSFYLFVGRLEEKKNIVGMLEAFARAKALEPKLSKTIFVLAGRAGYGYDRIQSAVKRLSLENSVKQIGWIPDADRVNLLNAAKIFLFASMYEGFGIPILEAFGFGTAVITSNRASCPEVAGDAALLVDPANPEEIAAAIIKLENDEKLLEDLRQKGLARAKEFSWTKCAKETLNLLIS